jgi:hypothetical protein
VRDQHGQVFVLVTLFMTVLLGMSMLVIDVGSWYLRSRQLQAAADAAATAGAQSLPKNPSAAVAAAQTYVDKNVEDATATITTPYKARPDQIAVELKTSAPSFFAKIFGIDSVTIGAHAAARHHPNSEHWAIFSYESNCSKGIVWPGSGTSVEGAVHTNSILTLNGADNHLGTTTYGGPNQCPWTDTNSGNTYGGGPTPKKDPSLEAWPEPWDASQIPCTYTASSFSWTHNNVTIPPGTYCATNQIAIPASYVTGTVTFVAPKVTISGSNETFRPYYLDLLILHYGTTNFNIAGSYQDLTGTIFVPNTRLGISGSAGSTYNLFLEGLYVSVSGSDWTLHGYGPEVDGRRTQLFE